MALQTPVVSISIQDMCLGDVICMSRHEKLFHSYMISQYKFYVTIFHMSPTYVVQH